MNLLAIDEMQLSHIPDCVKKARMMALNTIYNIYEDKRDDDGLSLDNLEKVHCAVKILDTCQRINNVISK